MPSIVNAMQKAVDTIRMRRRTASSCTPCVRTTPTRIRTGRSSTGTIEELAEIRSSIPDPHLRPPAERGGVSKRDLSPSRRRTSGSSTSPRPRRGRRRSRSGNRTDFVYPKDDAPLPKRCQPRPPRQITLREAINQTLKEEFRKQPEHLSLGAGRGLEGKGRRLQRDQGDAAGVRHRARLQRADSRGLHRGNRQRVLTASGTISGS